ncbi:hypothetical protein GE061_011618 [Apolygus lucorum]|uniref:Uncharacterized protein n=1 Tax=Apolygus lucorum TaxID=248454 RepID=A0A6A4JS55_APOLU|nr:hypothetical protein GE061_011618 [Apolygus lucorum]
MREIQVLCALVLFAAAAHASVVPVKGERKIADAVYLTRQKQILELYVGPKQREYYSSEFSDFDLKANQNQWTDPEVVNMFMWMYENTYTLPKNGIFTLYEGKQRRFATKLFDLFYFAKDFDTFYKAACWAKKRIEPVMFNYAFTLAMYHRTDCHQFRIPPMYEVFPDYFVPQETIQEIYNAKLLGVKEATFTYNNTGYEYNYNFDSVGGVLDYSLTNQHLENKISYFREDIGLNNYYLTWMRKNPGWMANSKYGKTWFKRGEGFYYTMQQLFARYTLERLANGLSWVDYLQWEKEVQVGYNPRVSHVGGQSFFPRSDNMDIDDPNNFYIYEARKMQDRVIGAIGYRGYWDPNNDSLVAFDEEWGMDYVGKALYGWGDFTAQKYYGNFYFKTLQGLGNIAHFKHNVERNYGAITCPFTTVRDPLYYNFLGRLIYTMQLHKFNLPPYKKTELGFPGVTVKNIEFDKLVTYFEMYPFNVFNTFPVKDNSEYKNFNYKAKQFRLNHKPYTYKVTVDSDASYDAMVRVFIGPKFDSEEHPLTLSQRRLAMFELDRFPVKMTAGQNVFERNSKESPIFYHDKEGFKDMFEKLEKAKGGETYYYQTEKVSCGFPDRFQLPRGWKSGNTFVFTVVVTPFTKHYDGQDKDFYLTCGSSKLYDNKPLGFPFDRPVWEEQFEVSNILTKDALIYHKDEIVNNN